MHSEIAPGTYPLVVKPGSLLSGLSWPVAATWGTFGLSSMTTFGRSPALASWRTLVIRLAKGTTSRLTVTPGWAFSNCWLYQFTAVLLPPVVK